MIPVPVLTPRLSSLWLWLVTPVYAGVGRKLVDSLKNETVVEDDRALEAFRVRPRGIHDAIARALAFEDMTIAQTRWSDEAFAEKASYGGVRQGSRLVDTRSTAVALPATEAFAPIQAIGGETGWYKGAALWRLRGLLDVLVGGPGLRRGRRDPAGLEVGDAVDFWRVEAFERDRLLRLKAEMKVPGRAWLQFEVSDGPSGAGSTIAQTAVFDPSGLFGLVYWYGALAFPRLHLRRHAAEHRRGGVCRATLTIDSAVRTWPESAQTRHTFRSSLRCHGGGTQSDRAA